MGGALVQLAAYGSQDIYLTTNPDVTYFKAVYRRHTNFAMESITQLIDGNIAFGGNITAVVARNGDLLGDIVLEVSLPNVADYVVDASSYQYLGWIQGVGNYLINAVSIEIGGQQIDQQYGVWMDVWNELTTPGSKLYGFGTMVGKDYSQQVWNPYDPSVEPGSRLYIPLQFWFCRNPGLAIPLIALQYHELRIKIQFEQFKNLIVGVSGNQYQAITPNGVVPPLRNFKIWNNYYYLDTIERRKFAQSAHEYLVEQVQTQEGTVNNITGENLIRLNLNHPVKELIFVINRNGTNAPINDFSMGTNAIPNGTPSQFAPLYSFKLVLNGTDRFTVRQGEYFRLYQNHVYHTRVPQTNYIYTYSFALRPEEHQPSGTCNFTRIDSAQLGITLRNTLVAPGNLDSIPSQDYTEPPMYTIFAPSYNILRVMGGMAGLSFSS
jgi:hypothetical protein